ncbi:hypothetical protein [Mucilaginibacter sp. KACC 22063]|uniref:hypothetical protein n=1 Tax=Mucilaginibacter sp. KACC 22063 TaxID=3025666 RepID=UPI0023662931|nr:hypothetical protein [Mucilaginibacter sp. KACC 22063]WDF55167.1 hypothetical protein PQ461_19740 [Mucilaginibacter sp. KACC 22063]
MEFKPPAFAKLENNAAPTYQYAVCTLVTNLEEYGQMVQSFIDAGFTQDICEYRYIDNSKTNTFEAYEGLNLFLQKADAEYIILCHQDVLLQFDGILQLNHQIAEISKLDNNWAVLSNAGGLENDLYRRFVVNIVYPDGLYECNANFPKKVVTVDENFIVVKRSANLALSHDLKGFHLYGTDICLVAELLGFTAYAIEFKLLHKSYGNADDSYQDILQKLIAKYTHFMRSRYVLTTIAHFYLSASTWRTRWFKTKMGSKISRKLTKIAANNVMNNKK